MKCRLCRADAVAVFTMDEGCFCCKDTEQALCYHHIMYANPLGSMELKEDLTVDQAIMKMMGAAARTG